MDASGILCFYLSPGCLVLRWYTFHSQGESCWLWRTKGNNLFFFLVMISKKRNLARQICSAFPGSSNLSSIFVSQKKYTRVECFTLEEELHPSPPSTPSPPARKKKEKVPGGLWRCICTWRSMGWLAVLLLRGLQASIIIIGPLPLVHFFYLYIYLFRYSFYHCCHIVNIIITSLSLSL